ncbi:CsbD family protein [Candidatus Mycosynbacter amalyticus]|uniref:CsbD family protein n=1 Tax=Candidatus Mycosynbacter amalyticus TaxID=2665156 RepID=A0A857MKY0_9BACT|nr:CsbD family protein [Candidatus Mycosynbacter amalyticus]QHN43223.1 CsbD family protein [Candidatus Mycosynbacter amalyticus]
MSLVDDISGKAKEVTGKVTGDQELEAKGKAQQIAGDLKDKADETKDKVGDAVNEGLDNVRDRLNGDDKDEPK